MLRTHQKIRVRHAGFAVAGSRACVRVKDLAQRPALAQDDQVLLTMRPQHAVQARHDARIPRALEDHPKFAKEIAASDSVDLDTLLLDLRCPLRVHGGGALRLFRLPHLQLTRLNHVEVRRRVTLSHHDIPGADLNSREGIDDLLFLRSQACEEKMRLDGALDDAVRVDLPQRVRLQPALRQGQQLASRAAPQLAARLAVAGRRVVAPHQPPTAQGLVSPEHLPGSVLRHQL